MKLKIISKNEVKQAVTMAEAGDLIIPIQKRLVSREDIHGEVGEVAAGKIARRETDKELTIFKSVGVAVQDVAVAELILRRCQDLDLGGSVDI
jgi:ornithine cyclodeaminase